MIPLKPIILIRNIKKRYKNQVLIFLTRLLALCLTGWPCFYLIAQVGLVNLIIDLIVNLVISKAVLTADKITASLLK